MKMKLIPALLASALLMATRSLPRPRRSPRRCRSAGQAGKVVIDASTRILTTLQQRRSEFSSNPASLRSYIDSELNRTFDRDYAARLVLGSTPAAPRMPTSSCSPMRWPTA